MAIPISVNGKTVFVKTLDEALNFDYQEAIANNSGMEINNPFFDHSLSGEEIVYDEYIQIEIPIIEEIEGYEELDLEEDF